jgi:nucleoside recognition membrane protein YjiH
VLSVFTNALLSLFHLPANLDIPLISGMFEITLGSKISVSDKMPATWACTERPLNPRIKLTIMAFGSKADAALLPKAMIVSFILGFSGLSVQAQVAGILSETENKECGINALKDTRREKRFKADICFR